MEEVIDFKAVNLAGRNCVMLACVEGDLERLKYLIEKGGSIDVVDKYQNSCLHLACSGKQNFDIVKYLLEEGMDVNMLNQTKSTALHRACAGETDLSVLEILLKAGAYVNAINGYEDTAFLYLCQHGEQEAIKLFLDAGSDWSLKNKYGKTGLDYVRQFSKEVVVWLEEYINKLEISIENCKAATINVLCVGKRKKK